MEHVFAPQKPEGTSTTPITTLLSPIIVTQLISRQQYDEVSNLLYQAQQLVSQSAAPSPSADFLLTASQVCMVCNMLHVEAERCRASIEAIQRLESELSYTLQLILNVIYQDRMISHAPVFDASTSGSVHFNGHASAFRLEQSAIWKRIQNLFKSEAAAALPVHKPVLRPVSTGAETLKGGRPAPVEPVMMIYGLGPFQVYLRNRPVENWVNRKARAIFKYLILNHTKPVPKEVLMDCFWAESDAAASRNNLNVAVYNLRQTLHQIDPDCSHILFQDDAYYLNPDLNTWIDFEFFREQFQRGQRFERAGEKAQAIHEYTLAEALYHGPLFEDDRYEEWLDSERKGLENAYQCILNQLSEYYLEEKNYAACMATCNKMLLMDSCWDEAHQRLMQCYDQQGQYYLALRQYHLCVENYQKELETQPSAETTRLYEQIRLR